MRISSNQYRRLFIVSFIPLMGLGFFTSKILFHQSGMEYSYFMCTPSWNEPEICREVGEYDGGLHQRVKSQHSAWFEVEVGDFDKDAPYLNFISASTRVLPDVQIVRTKTYFGSSSENVSMMASLPGQKAVIILGMKDGEKSFIQDKMYFLYCNNLKFEENTGEYSSDCFGDEFRGLVTYQVTGYSRDVIDKLRSAIQVVESRRKYEYDIFRIVMYPMFVYLFLLASFVIFIISKAIRYVKAG